MGSKLDFVLPDVQNGTDYFDIIHKNKTEIGPFQDHFVKVQVTMQGVALVRVLSDRGLGQSVLQPSIDLLLLAEVLCSFKKLS